MKRTASYFRTPQLGGATPRETEILAFGLCNERLTKADTPHARIEALHKTHELWSLLVKDLQLPGNALPQDLKDRLTALGFWAMSYSTRAMPGDLPVQPLIDINRNMIEGLREQAVAAAAVAATTWTEQSLSA